MASDLSPNCIVLRAGKFDTRHGAGPAGVAQVFKSIADSQPDRLVIHFHGGLVDRTAGMAAAERLRPMYSEAGATPLFIIWESGWMDITDQRFSSIFQVLQDTLTKIHDEEAFKRILRRVAQFVKAKLDKALTRGSTRDTEDLPLTREDRIQAELDRGAAGATMFSDVTIDSLPQDEELSEPERRYIEQQIERDTLLASYMQEIANARKQLDESASRSVTVQGAANTLMDPEVLDEIAPFQEGGKGLLSLALLAKHIAAVVGAVITRLVNHRDHGSYLTIMEEVMREFYVRNAGRFLWDGMKSEIAEAFGLAEDCGGTALVNALQDLWRGTVRPQITLVGHSAGSIYISRLLRELDAKMPDEFKCDVILIAPACTFSVFAEALKVAGSRLAGLRIFGMSDPIEREDRIAPVVYPASLLYFVSGVLEGSRDEPLLGMQRYYGAPYEGRGFEEVTLVRSSKYLTRDHAFAWSETTGIEGASCDMRKHGGWIDAEQTRSSLLHIIENGFDYS